MKNIGILFFLMISTNAYSQNAYRYESDIRLAPRDILEYYLILPGKPYYKYYGDDDAQSNFSEFEFRKKYLRPMPDMEIVVDKKMRF